MRDAPEDLESLLAFETLISDTSARLIAAPSEQVLPAVERALERVRRFFRADRCALLSVSADRQHVHVRLASYADGVVPVPSDLDLAPMFPWSRRRLLVERAPIRISRMVDLPPEADAERPSWELMSIRSALTLPIETGEDGLHLIVLHTVREERDWPDTFVTRLRVLAQLIVSAIEREDMLAGLRRSEARLASGAELAGLGFYEIDLGRGLASLDLRFRDICGIPPEPEPGFRGFEFWLDHLHPDDRSRVLELREQMHAGTADRISAEYRYLHPDQGEKWVHHLARVSRRDLNGRAVVTYGVLRDVTQRKRTEDGLRDLSRRLISAHEEERALLARELHDDVTQRLAVLAIEIGQAELAVHGTGSSGSLRSVREGLVRLSEDVHTMAYQLHPSVLAELGLVEALRVECERVRRRGPFTVSSDLAPLPAPLGKDAALCLFRVAQEALNNASRHARAHAVNVVLRPMDEGLLLAVRDDGAGFDPEASKEGRSLGLASMRERVWLAKGTLDIESAPGRGTSIVAWVPTDGASR